MCINVLAGDQEDSFLLLADSGPWGKPLHLWVFLIFRVKRLSFPPEFLCDPVTGTGRTIEQKTSVAHEITVSAATAICESTYKTFREMECSCWCNE